MKVEKLKILAAVNDITKKDLAELVGVHPSTMRAKIEDPEKFKLNEGKKIADFFGVTVEELFFYDGVAKSQQLI